MKHTEQGAKLLDRLAKGNDRLLIIKDGSVLLKSREAGIKPLLEAIQGIPVAELRNASVADVVVGKAGALLMACANVAFVASRVMSETGMDTLRVHEIPFYTQKTVPAILGRNANQQCPFEKAVRDVTDPRRAFDVLSELAHVLSPGA